MFSSFLIIYKIAYNISMYKAGEANKTSEIPKTSQKNKNEYTKWS